jgi:hypothetical protein
MYYDARKSFWLGLTDSMTAASIIGRGVSSAVAGGKDLRR